MDNVEEVDVSSLPESVMKELVGLKAELDSEYLTLKGYKIKREKLLAPFSKSQLQPTPEASPNLGQNEKSEIPCTNLDDESTTNTTLLPVDEPPSGTSIFPMHKISRKKAKPKPSSPKPLPVVPHELSGSLPTLGSSPLAFASKSIDNIANSYSSGEVLAASPPKRNHSLATKHLSDMTLERTAQEKNRKSTPHSPAPPPKSPVKTFQGDDQAREKQFNKGYAPADGQALSPIEQEKERINMKEKILQLAGRQQLPDIPKEITEAVLDERTNTPLTTFPSIATILRFRAFSTPKEMAFLQFDEKGRDIGGISFEKLNTRAEKLSHYLMERLHGAQGVFIVLLYKRVDILEYIVAFFACIYAGCVAVPIISVNDEVDFQHITFILGTTSAKLGLTVDSCLRPYQKELQLARAAWPADFEFVRSNEAYPSKKRGIGDETLNVNVQKTAYIEYSQSVSGEVKGAIMTHEAILNHCKIIKVAYHMDPTDVIVVAMDEPRLHIGCLIGILFSVYNGTTTIYPAVQVFQSSQSFLTILTKVKATRVLSDYSTAYSIMLSFNEIRDQASTLAKKHAFDIKPLKNFFIETFIADKTLEASITRYLMEIEKDKSFDGLVKCILTLPEHGGVLIASQWGNHSTGTELLVNREAMKHKTILISTEKTSIKGGTTIASFGQLLPLSTAAIVDPETKALCPPNTFGEIWVQSPSLATGFWALPKLSQVVFDSHPLYVLQSNVDDSHHEGTIVPIEEQFCRSGLVGFMDQEKGLFILGLMTDMLRQLVYDESGGHITISQQLCHFSNHFVSSCFSKVVGLTGCVAFTITLHQYPAFVIVAETSREAAEFPSIVQSIMKCSRDYHQVPLFAVAVCSSSTLSRYSRYNVIRSEFTSRLFKNGRLKCLYLEMNSNCLRQPLHYAISKYIKPGLQPEFKGDYQISFGAIRGRLPLDDKSGTPMANFTSITNILIWRADRFPDEVVFVVDDIKKRERGEGKPITMKKFHQKVTAMATWFVEKKGIKPGSYVIVSFSHCVEFIITIHACLYAGFIPIPLCIPDSNRLEEDVPLMLSIIEEFNVDTIIVNSQGEDIIKGKMFQGVLKRMQKNQVPTVDLIYPLRVPTIRDKGNNPLSAIKTKPLSENVIVNGSFPFPQVVNIGKAPSKSSKVIEPHHSASNPESPTTPCLVFVYTNMSAQATLLAVSHDVLLAQAKVQKMQNMLATSRMAVSCHRSHNGLGFLSSCITSLYVGNTTFVMTPGEFYLNPFRFFELLDRYKVKDAFVTAPMVEHILRQDVDAINAKSISLHNVRNLTISLSERMEADTFASFHSFFLANRLDKLTLSPSYSPFINPMVTSKCYIPYETIALKLSLSSLRRRIVEVINDKDSNNPYVTVNDCGMVVGNTVVAIVDPTTCQPCKEGEIGEIWVSSEANVLGYMGSHMSPIIKDHFYATLDGTKLEPQFAQGPWGKVLQISFARTGDYGFLYPIQLPSEHEFKPGYEPKALFFLSKDDVFEEEGFLYIPVDIESMIEIAHEHILPKGCMVFKYEGRVVLLVEISSEGVPYELASLIEIIVFEEHQLLLDEIVFLQEGGLIRSRFNGKQRYRMLQAYAQNKLDKVKFVFNTGKRPLDGTKGPISP